MRPFSIPVLVLLGILTASLGLSSPLPYLANFLKEWRTASGNNHLGLIPREVMSSLTERIPDDVESWDIEDCNNLVVDCYFRNPSDEAEARVFLAVRLGLVAYHMNFAGDPNNLPEISGPCEKVTQNGRTWWKCFRERRAALDTVAEGDSDADVVKDNVAGVLDTSHAANGEENPSSTTSSTTLSALSTRQLVDSTLADIMETPCAKAIIAKYDSIDNNATSVAEQKAFLDEIIACVYGLSTSTKDLTSRETTDANLASEAAKRCSQALIQNAYLKTHWDFLKDPNKTIWWMVLTQCLKQEPGSNIKLRGQSDGSLSHAEDQRCAKNVVDGWAEEPSTDDEWDALMLAMMSCINPTDATLTARDVGEINTVPEKVNKKWQCMRTVPLRGSHDSEQVRSDWMAAINRCIDEIENESMLPPINANLPKKRAACPTRYSQYWVAVNRRLTQYVRDKHLDQSRWPSGLVIDGLRLCTSKAAEWYVQECESTTRTDAMDGQIQHCWFEMFAFGGPGCGPLNPCMACGQDRPPHICP